MHYVLFVGVIYAWSLLKVPLMENGWDSSVLALNYTVTMCFFCLGSLFAGLLSKHIHIQYQLFFSALLVCAGFVMTSRIQTGNAWLLLFSYGILIGWGTGIGYNVLITTANAWFPDKKGLSSGILMMSFGFSALVVGNVVSNLFSVPAVGWKKAYIGLGVSMALVLILCSLLLHLPEEGANPTRKKEGNRRSGTTDYSAAEMVRRPSFWIYYSYGILGASVGSAIISFARELSISFGASLSGAAILVGALSACNGIARILCGLWFDKLGRRKTMFLASGITISAPMLMIAALVMKSLPMAVVAICLTGVSFGTNPTISAAFIGSFYGMKHYALNYSISNTKLLFSSFAATLTNRIFINSGSYIPPFVLLCGFAMASLCLLFLIRKP